MGLTVPQHQLRISGNTAGATASLSSGTVTLAGGNGITLSQAGNAVTISGAAAAAAQTAISGIAASNTTYTSGTVTLTGVGGGVTVSSNTGQRVDISVAAPVAQTVQTQNVVDVSLSGNTAGALALISSGTLTLAGGNNITLSQAGNAVTVSGPNTVAGQTFSGGMSTMGNTSGNTGYATQRLNLVGGNNITLSGSTNAGSMSITISGAAAGGAQTAISGIAASNTTYTSGTVTFTGVGGGVTVSSNTGQRVDISVAAQSVQPETQTFVAGIQNSQTTYTSGTVNLSVVAGNLTIRSTTGQAFQFSASQTVQPETQTFVGGIAASNTTYTSGTVTITGVGGGITVSSNTGQRVDLSVAAQTTQTQGILSAGVSTGGNTSGNTTVNTGSRMVFVGSNNITLSQGTAAGATTITISGPSVAGAQTGISGVANSQTTYTSGTVSLSELGAITIRSTTGQQYQFSVNAQTTQTQGILSAGVSTGGNTAGNTTVNTGSRLVLVGSGNLTASQATAAGASTITLSVAAQSVQPETQTAISGIANSQTTYTSGTVSLSELGAITVRSTTGNQFQLSVNAYSAGISTNGNTAGDTGFASHRLALIGGNNITLSGSTNAGSMSLTISGPAAGGAQTGISGIANSQTTYTSGTVSLSELGAITIRSTTGNQYQFSVNAQSVQPETQTFIAGIANSQTTYTSGTVSLSELGAITVRSTTGNQYQLSVNAQTTQTQGILSMGVSTGGNTAGNTQVSTGSRMVIVASGNATASQATAAGASTITISVGTQTIQTADVLSVGASNLGNTAGNTTVNTGSRLVFVGTNMISLSQTTGAGATTLSINATQSAQTQSNIQALFDGANSISTGTVSLANANGVTFSVNAQTLSASVNQSISMHAVSNTTQSTSGTAHKSALSFGGAGIASVGVTGGSVVISVPAGGGAGDGGVFGGVSTMGNTAGSTGTVSTGNFVLVGTGPISLSQSTGAAGSAATVSIDAPATSSLSATGLVSISTDGSTISIGVPGKTYSQYNAYANMERIAGVVGQGSLQMMPWPALVPYQHDRVAMMVHYTQATNSTLTVTVSGWFGLYTKNASTLSLLSSGSGTFSINGSGTASSNQNSGNRMITFGYTNTVPPDNYWLAVISRTTTAGNNATLSNLVLTQQASTYSGLMGVAAAASAQVSLGLGTYSATTSVLPASIAFSQLTGSGATAHRPPVVIFMSGTA